MTSLRRNWRTCKVTGGVRLSRALWLSTWNLEQVSFQMKLKMRRLWNMQADSSMADDTMLNRSHWDSCRAFIVGIIGPTIILTRSQWNVALYCRNSWNRPCVRMRAMSWL